MSVTTCAKFAIIITAAVSGVACYGQNPASAPTTAPAPLDPTIDKILTRLEDREVHDLRTKVSWKLLYTSDAEDEAVTKTGELWYQEQKPVAKFLVHFDAKITGGRMNKLDERHMFDGRWYIVLNSETKTFEKREIRREGDVGNPYRLGEGPFPLPFGQKKADILREFNVTLVPAAPDDPPDTDHLRLEPRPETRTSENYKTVNVWIAKDGPYSGLPVKVHTSKRDGTGKVNSFITITFSDVRLNEGFSSGVFELKRPEGYAENVETLDAAEPPPDAGKGLEPDKPKTP